MIIKMAPKIKSGWSILFHVLSVAGQEKMPEIAQLAFKTAEKVINEHFDFITDAFVEFITAFIKFAKNQKVSDEISLRSISHIETCVKYLIEGRVKNVPVVKDKNGISFKADSCNIWFPILTGLSSLIHDPRLVVRIKYDDFFCVC
jgi:hypothetical protein